MDMFVIIISVNIFIIVVTKINLNIITLLSPPPASLWAISSVAGCLLGSILSDFLGRRKALMVIRSTFIDFQRHFFPPPLSRLICVSLLFFFTGFHPSLPSLLSPHVHRNHPHNHSDQVGQRLIQANLDSWTI